ncbi:formyltransferase family protein [Chryseobacterium sp. MYb264]|uniref:methionyl-tRNA formyltransferase n=1 Tax=Chryseobacterium sp. MYb264 TaxID=2745153 RepID=UPI002E13D566|nr:formyltransferase family protein [Chryseobacterium sp. MYb264]
MKIIILTQEDSFSVPRNIEKLIKLGFVEITEIIDIHTKSSLVNKKDLFIKGFGWAQTVKMGLTVVSHKVINTIDSIFGYKLKVQPRSLKAVAGKYNIPFSVISNPNEESFLARMNTLSPDIIVSYSAPVVFKDKLLRIPKNSCINLHCSYLPHYAGVMPSFWTLYKKEKSTGVTVHYMDSKIDNGKILGQERVEIAPNETMKTLIEKTKEVGGNVMCEVIKNIHNGTKEAKDNPVHEGSYFTWPTVENFKDFRKNGGRLI